MEPKNSPKRLLSIGLGIAIGADLGVALDNMAIWLPLGVAVGAALDVSIKKKH